MDKATQPVMTRIALTRVEYNELRKRAIDTQESTADYLARLVRSDAARQRGDKQK